MVIDPDSDIEDNRNRRSNFLVAGNWFSCADRELIITLS